MIDLVSPAPAAAGAAGGKPKLRVLLSVWGGYHTNIFCKYCLPQLLAPGNLPALQEAYDVEFVCLTLLETMPMFNTYPAFRALRERCAVKFIPIDDLLIEKAYGITLTLAFLRGMTEGIEDETQVTYVFLNADFFFSDGSFRQVVEAMKQGYSGVVAPSFRCVGEDFMAYLDERLDDVKPEIALQPRELVRLGFDMMHTSFQSKILTQDDASTELTNQFLWQVDHNTMIGRFYLMFMLCIKPERKVEGVLGYCDYTFIPELCPSRNVKLLNDSDQTFIMEVQFSRHEARHVSFAPWDESVLAKRIAEWTTAMHRWYADQTCYFHAADLPPETAGMVARADRFVAQLTAALPPPLPHRDHIYWVGTLETALHMVVDGFRVLPDPLYIAPPEAAAPPAPPPDRRLEAQKFRQRGRLTGPPFSGRFPNFGLWHPDWLDFELARRWLNRHVAGGSRVLLVTSFKNSPLVEMVRHCTGGHATILAAQAFATAVPADGARFEVALFESDPANLDMVARLAWDAIRRGTVTGALGLFARATALWPAAQFEAVPVLGALHRFRMTGADTEIFGVVSDPTKQALRLRVGETIAAARPYGRRIEPTVMLAAPFQIGNALAIMRNNRRLRGAPFPTTATAEMSSILIGVDIASMARHAPGAPQTAGRLETVR